MTPVREQAGLPMRDEKPRRRKNRRAAKPGVHLIHALDTTKPPAGGFVKAIGSFLVEWFA